MQKYRAKKTEVNGLLFASKLEAERYKQLMLLQRAGEISDLQLQPEFQIFEGYVNCYDGKKHISRFYVGDFMYIDMRSKQTIVEDTKGMETDVFRLKWEEVQKKYPEYVFRKLTKNDV